MKLTQKQARKVLRGGSVQLKPEQLSLDGLPADTPMRIQKQIHRALRANKGMRLKLEPQEMQGGGFLDWLKSLGNMIKTPLKILAPVLKPIAKEVGAPILSQYTGIPTDVIKQGVDVVSNVAGVGLRGRKPKLSDDFSTMMNPMHPVFGHQPILPAMDMSAVVNKSLHKGGGVMFDSKQFTNPFVPVKPNFTAGAGSFKLAKGMKRAGSFKLN